MTTTVLDDVTVNGTAIKDWTIDQHTEALDTLGAHIYEPFPGVVVLGGGSKPHTLRVRTKTPAGEVESEIVDALACYSAVPFGHKDPVLVAGVCQFVAEMATIPRSISHAYLGPWLTKLREYTQMEMFLPRTEEQRPTKRRSSWCADGAEPEAAGTAKASRERP